MRRSTAGVIVGALGILGLASPALASIDELELDDTAVLQTSSTLTVTGTIECSADQQGFKMKVLVQQDTGSGITVGRGTDAGTCNGATVSWSALVQAKTGTFFVAEAKASVAVSTFVDGEKETVGGAVEVV